MTNDLTEWLSTYCTPASALYIKRLSANDTQANRNHQAGPYVPKSFLLSLISSINRTDIKNPDHYFPLKIDSHGDERTIRAIYYNNKRFENKPNGRDEARLTGFGGSSSPLLDPESTGALTIFSFQLDDRNEVTGCHIWLCRDETEENLAEGWFGPVEPKRHIERLPERISKVPAPHARCWLEPHEIPAEWILQFPPGLEIIRKALELRPETHSSADKRLIARRECEYEIFRSLEEAIEMPAVQNGFESLSEFLSKAQTVLQRRKARAGRSLELHIREILLEESFNEGVDFQHEPESEPGKRPDFLFPSGKAYNDPSFPSQALRMLAAKTTCRDRWRQVLNEANRIPVKHLLTLQEGVSVTQFREMKEAKVQLVVPEPLITSYPESVRSDLITLEKFLAEVRDLRETS